ncbi:MAG: hypothetical protein MJZ68_02715 [archaeon]|nr:hypothetical protein [archaeon]
MFKADPSVLKAKYRSETRKKITTYPVSVWKSSLEKKHIDFPDGCVSFFDSEGNLHIDGSDDEFLTMLIENIIVEDYNAREADYKVDPFYVVHVDRWWDLLKPYVETDGRFATAEYKDRRITMTVDNFEGCITTNVFVDTRDGKVGAIINPPELKDLVVELVQDMLKEDPKKVILCRDREYCGLERYRKGELFDRTFGH